MSDLDPLICDFLVWLQREPRAYAEVMDVWRTSCPRLTVWEDAMDRSLVSRALRPGAAAVIAVTDAGRELLIEKRGNDAALIPAFLPENISS